MLILNRNGKRFVAGRDGVLTPVPELLTPEITPNIAPIRLLVSEFNLRGRPIDEQSSLRIGVHLQDQRTMKWTQIASVPDQSPLARRGTVSSPEARFRFLPDEDLGGITFAESLFVEGPTAPLDQDDCDRLQLLATLIGYEILCLQGYGDVEAPFFRYLGTMLKQVRLRLNLSEAELALLAGTTKDEICAWERGRNFPTRGSLKRWTSALRLRRSPSQVLTVADATPQLVQLLERDPSHLHRLSPEQFEAVIAELLERMGYAIQLTGNTNAKDGGIDIIAVPKSGPDPFLLAVQVKHHKEQRPTGRAAVDRLLAWQGSPFRAGMLVTNSRFSRDAIWLAQQNRAADFLRLRDIDDLRRWLHGSFNSESEWREIPDAIQLAPGVSVRIPKPRFTESGVIWP